MRDRSHDEVDLGQRLLPGEDLAQGHGEGPGRRSVSAKVVLYTAYVALLTFKPSEAFLVEYLVDKGIEGVDTERALSRSVLAVFTYSRGPALLLCLLLCRFWGCKIVVVLGALCGLATTVLTLFSRSLVLLQVSQVSAAFYFAGLIAFDALQFDGMSLGTFQLVSHLTKGFTLASCCVSSLLGQCLRGYVGDRALFAMTLGFEAAACLLSLFLPGGGTSRGWGRRGKGTAMVAQGKAKEPFRDFLASLRQQEILQWTILWTFCYAVHDLVLTNWQILAELKLREFSGRANWNGYMWSAGYLVSSLLTLGTSSFGVLQGCASFAMVGTPLVMGLALFTMDVAKIASFYLSFVLFQAAFQLTAAVRNAAIAKCVGAPREAGQEEGGDDLLTHHHRGSGSDGSLRGGDKIFVLSAILWLAGGAGVGLEALVQGVIQSIPALSFADAVVWEAMASFLSILSLCFATFFLVTQVRTRKRRKKRRHEDFWSEND